MPGNAQTANGQPKTQMARPLAEPKVPPPQDRLSSCGDWSAQTSCRFSPDPDLYLPSQSTLSRHEPPISAFPRGSLSVEGTSMATPAQIAANQANAQLSTGPSTAEGKARVSHSASRRPPRSGPNDASPSFIAALVIGQPATYRSRIQTGCPLQPQSAAPDLGAYLSLAPFLRVTE